MKTDFSFGCKVDQAIEAVLQSVAERHWDSI